MKKLFALTVIIVIAALSGLVLSTNFSFISSTQAQTQENERRSSGVIEEFWASSLRGDRAQSEDKITTVPSDFYEMTNRCAALTPKNVSLKSVDRIEDGFEKAINITSDRRVLSDQIAFEKRSLESLSEQIQNESYLYYQIGALKEFDDYTMVEVRYGDKNYLPFGHLFLLHRENGEWKIFMMTNRTELARTNKYFLQTSCSDN